LKLSRSVEVKATLAERRYRKRSTNNVSECKIDKKFQEVVMRIRIIFFVVLVITSAALFAAEQMSKIEKSPAYDKMKTLVGSWQGAVNENGKPLDTRVRFKLVSDGSVLASWLGEDTPHEMVTMFHMDGNNLMATHYCAAHNQPRLVLMTGDDPNRLVFKFKDGTNIQADAGHMQQVAFIFEGADHHIEEWTYLQNGKEETTRFDFRRKS
jgi:hypothetical protein